MSECFNSLPAGISGFHVTSSPPCCMNLTKDFPTLQYKFHPVWRKFLFPLKFEFTELYCV